MLYALVAIMGLGLVDSYFISWLGTKELAAIALIIPITSLVTSIGLGLGMAISSLNSKLIGANQLSSAARLISDGFYLTALVSVVAVLILALFMESVFRAIGADQTTLPAILDYMNTWLLAVPLMMFTMVTASTFRSIGDTAASARITLSMTLCNIVLDPLLIFGLGPFPKLGMQGAALATVMAVALSCAYGIYTLAVKEKLLTLAMPAWQQLKQSLTALSEIALPAILANAIVPLTAAVLTRLVSNFGTHAVAGYGVGIRIEAVSLIIIYALSSTLPMFIGQNLGAQNFKRVRQAIKIAFKFTFALQLFVYLLLAILSGWLADLFSDEQIVRTTIKWYLWIVPLSYGFSGIVVLTNVSMNVLGKPRLALYINLLRLCLLYFPLAWLGAQLAAIPGLFAGVAISNVLASALALYWLRSTLKQVL